MTVIKSKKAMLGPRESTGPLAKEDGSITVWPQNAGFAGEILVTKAVAEADLPKVVKFLDWCNSDEGQTMLNCGVQDVTYWLDENGYRVTPSAEDTDKTNASKQYLHDLNQLGMGVTGRAITPPLKLTALRQRYEDLNAALAPYAVLDPTYPLISETNVAVGATISTIISDAAVQYIAGQIDEAGLQAAWDDWAAQGGDLITEEFNEAYHAAQN